MDIYAENILDHYRSPRNTGSLDTPSVTHEERNLSCGDHLHLHLHIADGRITDIAWEGSGCAISQAGMSLLSEELKGKTMDEAQAYSVEMMRELLGVPVGPRRFKCAYLALHTLKNTLRISAGRETEGWQETIGDAI